MANFTHTGEDYGEVCFDELGCFPKLYGCIIPTVTTPLSPGNLGVTFQLFTNKSHQTFNDNPEDAHIEMSDFDPNLDTKVIIHGFKNGFTEQNWMGVSIFMINIYATNVELLIYYIIEMSSYQNIFIAFNL